MRGRGGYVPTLPIKATSHHNYVKVPIVLNVKVGLQLFLKFSCFNFLTKWFPQLCPKLHSFVKKTQGILQVNVALSKKHKEFYKSMCTKRNTIQFGCFVVYHFGQKQNCIVVHIFQEFYLKSDVAKLLNSWNLFTTTYQLSDQYPLGLHLGHTSKKCKHK
jgi:hypothetical protein